MEFFRALRKPIAVFGGVIFALSALLGHNLTFHVHSLGHDSSATHEHGPIPFEADHGDITLKHLSTDVSHANHHDGVVLELAATPDAVLQNLSIDPSAIDVVLIVVLLIIGSTARGYITIARSYTVLLQPQRFHLIPALRAPPR